MVQNATASVVDLDIELGGGGWVVGEFDLLALLAFLPSLISSSSTKNKGESGSPGSSPSPRSATEH